MTKRTRVGKLKSKGNYKHLLTILLRRRWWFLSTWLGTLAFCAALNFAIKPTYQSKMQVLVSFDPDYSPSNSFSPVGNHSQSRPNFLRNNKFIAQTIKLLDREYPDFDTSKLKNQLTINPVITDQIGTQIWEVAYSDDNPGITKEVLEVMEKIYQEYGKQYQQANSTPPEVRAKNVVNTTATDNGFTNGENQLDTINAALQKLEWEKKQLNIDYQATESFSQVVLQQLEISSPQPSAILLLNQSQDYHELRAEIKETDLAIAQKQVEFSPSHPHVTLLEAQRNQQNQLLRQQVEQVLQEFTAQVSNKIASDRKYRDTNLALLGQLIGSYQELIILQVKQESLNLIEDYFRNQLNRLPATQDRGFPEDKEEVIPNAEKQFNVQVVETPNQGEKITPDLQSNLLLGTVVGLCLGIFIAWLRDNLDDSIHSADDLQQRSPLPLLGVVEELPRVKLSKSSTIAPELLHITPWQPFRDSLDLIYTNIQMGSATGGIKSLAVTSALRNEGKSTLAIGLAISAARCHQKVLIIDANLRQPTVHQHLNLANERGLSNLLSEDTELPSVEQPCPMPHVWLSTLAAHDTLVNSPLDHNIDILTSGPIPKDPIQLLSSVRMKQLIAIFEQNYDFVILDTCSVLETADTIKIASLCSGSVLVGHLGKLTQSRLLSATKTLQRMNLIGLIVNGAKKSAPTIELKDNLTYSSHNQHLNFTLKSPTGVMSAPIIFP